MTASTILTFLRGLATLLLPLSLVFNVVLAKQYFSNTAELLEKDGQIVKLTRQNSELGSAAFSCEVVLDTQERKTLEVQKRLDNLSVERGKVEKKLVYVKQNAPKNAGCDTTVSYYFDQLGVR
jgi:hypothetical protein